MVPFAHPAAPGCLTTQPQQVPRPALAAPYPLALMPTCDEDAPSVGVARWASTRLWPWGLTQCQSATSACG